MTVAHDASATLALKETRRDRARRPRALALFWALLGFALIVGASTSVHNGLTLLALLFLAAAMATGIRIAVLDERAITTDPATKTTNQERAA